MGVDGKDIKIIQNLYWNQESSVLIDGELSNWIEIKRGVRQGCVLSPLLFNIYSEEIIREGLENMKEGIKINGITINNLRFADDTILLACSEEDLQNLLTSINKQSEKMGLKINENKTKIMKISKIKQPYISNININNKPIEAVNSITYLGRQFNHILDHSVEIKKRIGMAKSSFLKLKNILCNTKLNIDIKCKVLKCYVWSVLLYGCETWTLKKDCVNRLNAFEMWSYRRMLKIKWTDKVSNKNVLERVNQKRQLMYIIKKRKTQYLGHILRNSEYELPRLTLEGKRGRGRPRLTWLDKIKEWTKKKNEELFRLAQNREDFRLLVANLHCEDGT